MTTQSEIVNLFKSLKDKKGIQVFLHGSWADNSTTAFSDIDDFVIIDDTLLTNKQIVDIENELERIKNKFYKIDPLQHHGHWKVYQSELNDYNNSYIPLFILNNAINLIGNSKIESNINYSKTTKGLFQSVITTCENIEIFYNKYSKKNLNIYDLKRFVGSVLLLPPLLYQLKGLNYSKKEAIINANRLFSKNSLDLIKWASDLRINWKQLTNTDEYISFCNLQKGVDLSEWQMFSEKASPILDYNQCSEIELTDSLIEHYVSECLSISDSCSLQIKNQKDYDSAYEKIEKFAIKYGGVLVGKFGEIGTPGVSDLDIFVCFPDAIYKRSQEAFYKSIYSDKNLPYFVIHPAVCISVSMLPYLPYLHTISNLKITYNKNKKISLFKTRLSNNYIDSLNQAWTLFLLPIAENYINHINFIPIRDLLLVLKNIQTSIDNLLKQKEIESNEVIKSYKLRSFAIKNNVKYRIIIQTEFIKSYNKLISVINKFNTKESKYSIIQKKLILKSGKYDVLLKNKIKIHTFPSEFYLILNKKFDQFPPKKHFKKYFESYKSVDEISKKLFVNNPFVYLIQNIPKKNKSLIKRLIFNILSQLPFSISFWILKKIV